MTENLPDPHNNWPANDLTNTVLGRYHVTGRIGSGGMGEVYKATDTLLKRNVALKRVLPHFAQQEQSKKRLIREARAVSALSHPNIAGLYDVLESGDQTFLVMELVNGKPLPSKSPMPLEVFLSVAKQCLEALKVAHSKGIIHGDLKPSNVFLNESQNVKILDFGLARSVIAPEIVSTTVPKLAETGPEYGTLPYLSPEALTGKESDQRRDLFALGIIFYELLTGTYPFQADTVAAIAARIVNDRPTPPSDVNHKSPKELDALIFRLLEKDPAKRYSTAAEVIADLNSFERHLAQQTVSAQLKTIIRLPKRNQMRSVLSAVILISLSVVFAILIQRQFVKETPVFAERNWILLADFENTTGNVVFDQTLNEGLTVALQQSSHVNVFSRSRAFEALQRMARKDVKRIDESIGREICQRENLQVLLTGSIYRSGEMYQITLRAIEPIKGSLLFVEKEQFAKLDDLFQKVDNLAKAVRVQLGESTARIEKSARPLAKVTTPSIKALQHYSQASDAISKGEMEAARVELLSALSLDPNFAMAHYLIGGVYDFLGQSTQYKEHIERAFELRQSLTDREQKTIEASYFASNGQVEKSTEILKVLTTLYPDDITTRRSLAAGYRELGQNQHAIQELREVIRLNPSDALAYGSLILLLARTNANEDAISAYKKAIQQGVRTPELYWGLGMAYMGLGNLIEARQQFQKLGSQAGYQIIGDIYDLRVTAYEGKFSETIHRLKAGIAQDEKSGDKSYETMRRLLLAQIFYVREQPELVSEQLEIVLSGKLRDMDSADLLRAGNLYIRIGRLNKVLQPINELERRVREVPTYFRRSCYLNLSGELALAHNTPNDAIQLFLKADAELPWYINHAGMARAYEQLEDWKNADIEWQNVINSRGEIFHDGFPPEWILAHVELARVQVKLNNPQRAQSYYEQFKNLWQNADPIPIRTKAFDEWQKLTTELHSQGGKNVL